RTAAPWRQQAARLARGVSTGVPAYGAENPPGQCPGSTECEQGLMGREARQGLLPRRANASPDRAAPIQPAPEGDEKGCIAASSRWYPALVDRPDPEVGGGNSTALPCAGRKVKHPPPDPERR